MVDGGKQETLLVLWLSALKFDKENKNMNIKTAQYIKDKIADATNTIHVVCNGSELDRYVPMSEDNSDYQEILAWVAEGNTIDPADE